MQMGELGIPRAMCIDGEVGLLVRLKGSGKTGGNLLVVADVRQSSMLLLGRDANGHD